MISRLLVANGLTVGTYTSPHLERVNERITRNGEQITDEDLAEQIAAIADLELIVGLRPSYFEILTAAAFRWFADVAVDVMVIEVGLLGRWDATNVATADVAVITNIGMDHTEFAGPTLADIAREKAGIIKPISAAIIGETDPDLVEIFQAAGAATTFVRDAGLRDHQQPARGRGPPARPAHADHDLPRRVPAAARSAPGRQRDPRPHRRRDVLRRAARHRRRERGVRRGPDARPVRGARPSAARRSSTARTTRRAPTRAPRCSSRTSSPTADGSS